MKHYPTVLTIAGSDSSGGAGIQADLKTISALGCYGASVITALTAQNTTGVSGIFPIPAEFVEKQIEAVLSDIEVDAVKIGMLHSVEIILSVKKMLKKYDVKNIILDPVMNATSGDKLIEDNTIDVLVKELIPMASIITPNLDEAMFLLKREEIASYEMDFCARELLKLGCNAVLLKGGHLDETILTDVYADKDGLKTIESEKINSKNVHGTGCTMSSAIASYIALGFSMPDAVEKAQEYIHKAIKKGRKVLVGKGFGPVNHFFNPKEMVKR